tara:strand:- start:1664 stop:2944 length:1281 start_codon:yes stop_codon:yes gene_type:complete
MRIPIEYRHDLDEIQDTSGFKYCPGWPKKYLTSDYFIIQQEDTGMFGLFGEPFVVVFKDKEPTDEYYYFPIIVSLSLITDYIDDFEVPDNVLQDVIAGKCKFLIFNSYEGWDWEFWETKVVDPLKKKYNIKLANHSHLENLAHGESHLSDEHFVIASANIDNTSKFKTIYTNFWERQVKHENLDYLNGLGAISIAEKQARNKKFICLNRRPHAGRFAALTKLYPYKDQGYLSFGKSGQMYEGYFEEQEAGFSRMCPQVYEEYQTLNIRDEIPLVIDDRIDAERDNPVQDWAHEKFYDSFLHICPETFQYYRQGRIFFSEKIWKPIMFMQPFVLVGEPYQLRALRQMGYKTYDDFIDESYDTILNNQERLTTALQSAIDYFNKPIEELHKNLENMQYILTHNLANLTYRSAMMDQNLKKDLKEALYA